MDTYSKNATWTCEQNSLGLVRQHNDDSGLVFIPPQTGKQKPLVDKLSGDYKDRNLTEQL